MSNFKSFILLILLFGSTYLYAQKGKIEFSVGTFNDKGFPSFLVENGRFTYATTFYKTKIGLDYQYPLNEHFGVLLGYNFNYSYLQVNLLSRNPTPYYSGTKIYLHSIPLQFEFQKNLKKRIINSICLRLGAGVDIFKAFETEFGSYQDRTIESISFKDGLFYTLKPPKNPIPFIQAGVGLVEKINDKNSLRFNLGLKQQLSDFSHELYYYEKNDVQDPVIVTQTISRKVTYFTFDLVYIYSF